jgi:hypothetical protein
MAAWNFALLMHGYFGLTALAWRRTRYRISAGLPQVR